MFWMSPAAISNKDFNIIHVVVQDPLLLAASNRSPSTPSESKSFAYAASVDRTCSVSVARLDANGVVRFNSQLEEKDDYCILSKTVQLTGFNFNSAIPVDDIVIGLEAAVVKVLSQQFKY
jgi:hypothetical protein